jgi:hypothetical protein
LVELTGATLPWCDWRGSSWLLHPGARIAFQGAADAGVDKETRVRRTWYSSFVVVGRSITRTSGLPVLVLKWTERGQKRRWIGVQCLDGQILTEMAVLKTQGVLELARGLEPRTL